MVGHKYLLILTEDVQSWSTSHIGYTGCSNVEQNGKGKGAVARTVSNAAKNYLFILKTDCYS